MYYYRLTHDIYVVAKPDISFLFSFMLLYIEELKYLLKTYPKFKCISCSYLSRSMVRKTWKKANSNTSHVTVNF